MLFWLIFQHNYYVKIIGKITDQHLNVWLFSNPGDKVQILVESMGQICPLVLHLFWTLSPQLEHNHTFRCWSGIFLTSLTYMVMLENCMNNISVYGCSQNILFLLGQCLKIKRHFSELIFRHVTTKTLAYSRVFGFS